MSNYNETINKETINKETLDERKKQIDKTLAELRDYRWRKGYIDIETNNAVDFADALREREIELIKD